MQDESHIKRNHMQNEADAKWIRCKIQEEVQFLS